MLSKKENKRSQVEIYSLDDLVPKDHLVRKIDKAISFDFIYDLVEDLYCSNNGRPSIDPVVLIKIAFIQYMFGIGSMRKTIREIESNIAYRWFLGYSLSDPIPHFSTFGKNYDRRFKNSNLFEQIFNRIISEAIKAGFIDTSEVFIDSTHVKANANKNKYLKQVIENESKIYQFELENEINKERELHAKKPLKKN